MERRLEQHLQYDKPQRILAVGIATLDIINTVADYPAENSEVRILKQQQHRGGNATNTLITLSQLGHACSWAGVWVDHVAVIRQDFTQHHIDTQYCHRPTHGTMPTSYVLLNQVTGSRSITHYRDLPEYSFSSFKQIDLSAFDWVHFEGRNVEETRLMLAWVKQQCPQLPVSLEIEKHRAGIETLFADADVMFFSQSYVHQCGFNHVTDFIKQIKCHQADIFCAWGSTGAYARAKNSTEIVFVPVKAVQAIDTLGAGDVFNAGVINSYLHNVAYLSQQLRDSCDLAGEHCARLGFGD